MSFETAFLPNDRVTWRETNTEKATYTGYVVPADDPRLTAEDLQIADRGHKVPIHVDRVETIWLVRRAKLQKVTDIERRTRENVVVAVATARRALDQVTAALEEAQFKGVDLDYADAFIAVDTAQRSLRPVHHIAQVTIEGNRNPRTVL